MTLAIGKADYSGNNGSFGGKKRPTVYKLGHKKPEDRTMVLRIGPPVGALADRGIWARYIKQHFGYTIPFTKKDGSQANLPVTFSCIEERDREGNITKRCPECDEIKGQKEKIKAKEAVLKEEGKDEKAIDAALGYLKSWTRQHNLDKKWYFFAKNLSNTWAYGAISHSCYKLLKGSKQAPGIIDGLVAKGLDPLGEKGSWFRFQRNGTSWNDITDVPAVEMEETEPGVFRQKFDVLTQTDLDAIEKLAGLEALEGALEIRHLTYEQIETLVKSGNDEATVRAVMNMPKRDQVQPSQGSPAPTALDEEEPDAEDIAAQAPAAPAPASKPAVMAPMPAPTPPPVDDEEAAALAALKAIQAKKAAAAAAAQPAKAAPASKPAPAPAAMKEDLQMPIEDFLKKYEK